MTFVVQSADSS